MNVFIVVSTRVYAEDPRLPFPSLAIVHGCALLVKERTVGTAHLDFKFRNPAYDVWLSMTYFNRYLHTACTGWVGQHPSVAFLCEMHARVDARVSLQFINVHLRMENKRILHSLVISRSAMGVRCAGRAR